MKDKEVFERLSQNTKQHNSICLIEEMAELTKALTKELRGTPNRQNLTEEIAHVRYMLNVTTKCLGVPLKDIEQQIDKFEARMRHCYLESKDKGDCENGR